MDQIMMEGAGAEEIGLMELPKTVLMVVVDSLLHHKSAASLRTSCRQARAAVDARVPAVSAAAATALYTQLAGAPCRTWLHAVNAIEGCRRHAYGTHTEHVP